MNNRFMLDRYLAYSLSAEAQERCIGGNGDKTYIKNDSSGFEAGYGAGKVKGIVKCDKDGPAFGIRSGNVTVTSNPLRQTPNAQLHWQIPCSIL